MRTEAYEALDGSLVTELVRPEAQGSRHLSLAEAAVMPGQTTLAHYHKSSEEVYYVLGGRGILHIGDRRVEVGPGTGHLIRPDERHSIACVGQSQLRILCVCSPPYEHEDTVVV